VVSYLPLWGSVPRTEGLLSFRGKSVELDIPYHPINFGSDENCQGPFFLQMLSLRGLKVYKDEDLPKVSGRLNSSIRFPSV
jgi:hypothetical protein